MRCKPNQLCIVNRSCPYDDCIENFHGLTVTTKRPLFMEQGPHWLMKETVNCKQCGTPRTLFPDQTLTPISDPDLQLEPEPPAEPVRRPFKVVFDLIDLTDIARKLVPFRAP
jgi:hypothetical protein